MAAPKLTPWFDGDVRPVRPGLYRVWRKVVVGFPSDSYLRWTGVRWLHTAHSGGGEILVDAPATMCKTDGDRWRGLAQDPNKKGNSSA